MVYLMEEYPRLNDKGKDNWVNIERVQGANTLHMQWKSAPDVALHGPGSSTPNDGDPYLDVPCGNGTAQHGITIISGAKSKNRRHES